MIIEFNGVPGCGKTTLISILKSVISNDNINVYDTYDILEEMQKSKIKNLRVPSRHGAAKNSNKIKVFLAMLECVLYTKEFNKIYHWIVLAIRLKTNLHYLTRSIEIVAMYKYFESVHKGEILLVDQGILQNTISLIYLNEIEDIYFFENHFIKLFDPKYKMIIVNCKIDCENAVKRIRNRKLKHCRISRFDDKKLLNCLLHKSKLFSFFRNCASSLNYIYSYNLNTNFSREVTSNLLSKLHDKAIKPLLQEST